MRYIYRYVNNRLDIKKLIFLLGLCSLIGIIALIYTKQEQRNILPTTIAQSNLQDFYAWPDKDQYSATETVSIHIQGALPNTTMYWTNVINGVEATDSYQYDHTDASGNYTRAMTNFGQYGTGSWQFYISIGGVTKIVYFTVGNVMTLSFSKQSILLGDVVTISISGAPPNQQILWSGWINFHKVETDAYYQQNTDANGNWSAVWNVDQATFGPLKGQWQRSIKVGSQHASAKYSILEPYLEETSVRYEALRASAALAGTSGNETITGKPFKPTDYATINLCNLAHRFSIIRAKAISLTYRNSVNEFSDVKGWVILRPVAYLKVKAPEDPMTNLTVPADIQSLAQPGDLILADPGGQTYFPDIPGINGNPGFTISVNNDITALVNFPFFVTRETPGPGVTWLDLVDVIVFANLDNNRRLITIPYGDKGTIWMEKYADPSNGALYQVCLDCQNMGLLGEIKYPFISFSDFTNWLSTSGCIQ